MKNKINKYENNEEDCNREKDYNDKEDYNKKTKQIVKIKFKKKSYDINIEKLYYIIRKLKDDDLIEYKDYKTTYKYLKELKLLEENFLRNIVII